MPFVTQAARTADFIVSEANGQRSRENAVIAATTDVLPAGQVLSLGVDGIYVAYDGAGDDPDAPLSADAVLYASAPISTAEQMVVVIARDAEVAAALLVGLDAGARASLAGRGVLVRD